MTVAHLSLGRIHRGVISWTHRFPQDIEKFCCGYNEGSN